MLCTLLLIVNDLEILTAKLQISKEAVWMGEETTAEGRETYFRRKCESHMERSHFDPQDTVSFGWISGVRFLFFLTLLAQHCFAAEFDLLTVNADHLDMELIAFFQLILNVANTVFSNLANVQ